VVAPLVYGVYWGSPRPAAGLIQGYPYVGPVEDLKLKSALLG
jgi:hypothetical protein